MFLILCLIAAASAASNELDPKIVGGGETTIQSVPYQVSVQVGNQHVCGGAIINENTVLTAAHCVNGKNPSEIIVRAGITNIGEEGKKFTVQKVIQHERFTTDKFNCDISILKLNGKLTYGKTVQPIALQDTDVDVRPGTNAEITGWGSTKFNGPLSKTLRKATMKVIRRLECADEVSIYHPITESMLCAEGRGISECEGDAGGPLVANGKLIGVASWGYQCKTANVFARISELRPWIEKHINDA